MIFASASSNSTWTVSLKTKRYFGRSVTTCPKTYFFCGKSPTHASTASFLRFLNHTHWHTTFGRTTLDEGSAQSKDLYLTTYTRDRHPCPRRDFFLLSVLYLYIFVSIVLALPFVLYCTTHTTNNHAPGGIRTRNSSKRLAAGIRHRPPGHRYRHSHRTQHHLL